MVANELRVGLLKDPDGDITIRELHVEADGKIVQVGTFPLFVLGKTKQEMLKDLAFFAKVIAEAEVIDYTEIDENLFQKEPVLEASQEVH